MYMTFRWFGADDRVSLANVRQVPGVEGIVTALHDVPPGEPWEASCLSAVCEQITKANLRWSVVESIPIHEDIKLGRPTRDKLIDNWCESVRRVGEAGIPVVCYNFMPVFDWMRTDFAMPLGDGSTAMSYDHAAMGRIDLSKGMAKLPAWADGYDGPRLKALLDAYKNVGEQQLWDSLGYFLERVSPAAASANVKLGLHPDDPPWSIFGLPRIITNGKALEKVVKLVDHPANGITFCTGSLGANPENDLPAMVRAVGKRIHFAHCRNVTTTGDRTFHETPHPSRFGDVSMLEVLRALRDVGFTGPMRPDHGRMIWGEEGRPGYGLHDRALGAMYLQGLWEALTGDQS